jgi:adenylate cyclase class 2
MREIELKAAIDDRDEVRESLRAAGASLVFDGRMVDRRYDTPDFAFQRRDEVVRVRVTASSRGSAARLDLKGPASYPDGFKVREEVGSAVEDAGVIERVLRMAGLRVTREIERVVEVFELHDAVVRIEVYPRMDVLLEVEGQPSAIERAIAATGLERSRFTSERLADFVQRYERRTGQRAALCALELAGDFRYRLDDA